MRRSSSPIVGKTVAAMISKPGSAGEIIMLQFTDGTCYSFSRNATLEAQRKAPASRRQLGMFAPAQ